MEKLSAVLDGANAPQHAQGAVGRIALLAQRHPDNIHLNTFDLQHFLSLSDDEQEVALTHSVFLFATRTRPPCGSGCLSLSL